MHCWARTLLILVVVTLGVFSMIGACGRKGPLYLPEESASGPSAAQSDVPQTSAPEPKPESETVRP